MQLTLERGQLSDHLGLARPLCLTECFGNLSKCHLQAKGQEGFCVPFPLGL